MAVKKRCKEVDFKKIDNLIKFLYSSTPSRCFWKTLHHRQEFYTTAGCAKYQIISMVPFFFLEKLDERAIFTKETRCQLVRVSESWQMDSLNLAACFEKVACRRTSSVTKKENTLIPFWTIWQVVMGRMTFNKTAILRKNYLKTLWKKYLKHLGRNTLNT